MRIALGALVVMACGGGSTPVSPDASTTPATADAAPTTSPDAAPATSHDAAPAATFDPNGVLQIYPTNPDGAAPWTLGFGDWPSRTRQWGTVTGDGAATIVTAGGQVRLTVKAEESDCEGEQDHGLALSRGWMCSPLDWRNWEMTGYVRLDIAATDQADHDWTWYGNGGRHTGAGPPLGCLGSSYKASYDYVTGSVRAAKESWHVNYDQRPWEPVAGGLDFTAPENADRWLGMKVIRYETGAVVRVEVWLDLAGVDADGVPANDWQLVRVEEDSAATPWGSMATLCGAPSDDQQMRWGGPWVTWRWDSTTSSIRLMSVREILPP